MSAPRGAGECGLETAGKIDYVDNQTAAPPRHGAYGRRGRRARHGGWTRRGRDAAVASSVADDLFETTTKRSPPADFSWSEPKPLLGANERTPPLPALGWGG